MNNVPGSVKQSRLMQTQYAFTRHIRDPHVNPRPSDIEERRMQIYRELFYNNVEDFIASSFPVLRSIYADQQWHAMIRDYFSRHKARTPLFLEMPREFLHYLETERESHDDDPPYLLELAHYEWVELALSIAEQEISYKDIDPCGDLLNGIPVLSPLAWPLQYHYPVHQIGPDWQAEEQTQDITSIVVYRNPDDEVAFLEVNPVTATLIAMIAEAQNHTGREILLNIAEQLQHTNPDMLVEAGAGILDSLRQRSIILGCKQS